MQFEQLTGITFPILGNSRVMALVITTHVFFAFIAVGSFYVSLLAEYLGYKRNQPQFDRLAKGYMTFIAQMVKINGVLGVAILVLLISLFPIFTGWLYTIFFWPLIGEVFFFMVLMASSIWYRETWEKYANRKPAHLVIGIFCAGAATLSALIINAAQAFMLTPGKYFATKNLLDAVFNPTMVPSAFHLLIPCILNAAAVLGIYAYIQHRKKLTEQSYYNFVGAFTARITAWGILLQPPAGLFYLWVVYGANHTAFQNIISGISAPFFWTMVTLGSIGFILSIIYLIRGWERGKTVFLISAILVLFAFPFGAYNRERARKPFLVYGQMYMTQKPVVQPPIISMNTTAKEIVPSSKSGKDIIQEHNCSVCHVIQGKGGTVGPELKGLNKKFNADKVQLEKFLLSPPVAMPPFDGSSADLDILVEYLLHL